MKDHEIIELYWARNESAITATTEKYGNYCHTIAYNILRRLTHDKGLLRKCVPAVGEDMPGGVPAMAARSMPQPCWEKMASIRSWTHWLRYRSRESGR